MLHKNPRRKIHTPRNRNFISSKKEIFTKIRVNLFDSASRANIIEDSNLTLLHQKILYKTPKKKNSFFTVNTMYARQEKYS